MRQPRPTLSTSYCQRRLAALRNCWVEMLPQQLDHLLARVPIDSQERMVVADAVDALPNVLLAYVLVSVLCRQGLDSLLFSFDVALDLTPRAAGGVDLGCGDCYAGISEEVESATFLEN